MLGGVEEDWVTSSSWGFASREIKGEAVEWPQREEKQNIRYE